VIAIDGAIAFQLVQRDRSYVSQYENAEKIGSKIDYGDYYSFLVDNKLEVLQEKPDVMLGAIDFYAVTAWTSNPNVPVLLDWLQGRQGQAFIEQCGYVGIAK
jgi:hypothetical protein